MMEIRIEARGKQIGAVGELDGSENEGNWKSVLGKTTSLLGQSKHAEAFLYLIASAARIEGWPGFSTAVKAFSQTIKDHWGVMHPLPDTDDGDPDFYEMLGILDNMPMGYRESLEDPFRFVESMRSMIMAESREVGRFTLGDFHRARDGDESISGELLKAAYEQTDEAKKQEIIQAIDEAQEALLNLESFLIEKVGNDAPDLKHMKAECAFAKSEIESFSPQESVFDSSPALETAGAPATSSALDVGQAAVTSVGVSINGIASRQDAIKALDAVMAYFRHNEPSNPIPYFLNRCKRMVDQDFLTIIRELRGDLEPDFVSLFAYQEGEDTPMPKPVVAPSTTAAPTSPPAVQPEKSAPPQSEDIWGNTSL